MSTENQTVKQGHPVMTRIQHSRSVDFIQRGQPTSDGDGVRIMRVFDSRLGERLDPFLLFDEFGSDEKNDYIGGFPDHPHRGFETVTYMLAGAMRHEDSAGNCGHLRPGSVQWMTAGRGIIHSEMPEQEEGLMRGFQLWVNLPASHKLCDPRYQDIIPEQIPCYQTPNGIQIKVIAGVSHGVEGAISGVATQPLYVDLVLPPNRDFDHPILRSYNAFLYVYEGIAYVGASEKMASRGDLGVLETHPDCDGVRIATRDEAVHLVLIAGQPIGEPIVQWGPFVMNSREEIEQALKDYRSGRLVQ